MPDNFDGTIQGLYNVLNLRLNYLEEYYRDGNYFTGGAWIYDSWINNFPEDADLVTLFDFESWGETQMYNYMEEDGETEEKANEMLSEDMKAIGTAAFEYAKNAQAKLVKLVDVLKEEGYS